MEKRIDAITLLKRDHRAVKELFAQFRKLTKTRNGSPEEKMVLAGKIGHELAVHSAIEEQIFYPAARKAVSEEESQVLESLEEHHMLKILLAELKLLQPADERFEPKMKVLMEMVEHHIEEEETKLLPKVQAGLDREELLSIGDALMQAKTVVPDTPKPKAPDTPPRNLTPDTHPLYDQAMKAIEAE
ncbi:MAG TPA: hemerythrin domain-containing protein [Candidatus Xenobia bacterium]|jgi:hemerythrin-like domain-containing protein